MSEEKTEGVPTEAANEALGMIKESFAEVLTAAAEAWERIKPVVLAVARDSQTQAAATAALVECFNDDDETEAEARKALAELDSGQLLDVENAAVALSLIASRMRKERSGNDAV